MSGSPVPGTPSPGAGVRRGHHQQHSVSHNFNSSPLSNTPSASTSASNTAHTRQHSRIHERNLSAFFPRPGGSPAVGYGDTYADPHASAGGAFNPQESVIPEAGPSGISQFARDAGRTTSEGGVSAGGEKPARRGHHHKHSMSHNFFSFMDPTQTTPNGSDLLKQSRNGAPGPNTPTRTNASAFVDSTPTRAGFLPVPSHSLPRSRYSSLPAAVRFVVLCALYLPLGTQAALALGAVQVVLGALLWVTGQAGESLAVTGLGYMVVFDGIGTGCRTALETAGNGMELVWGLMASGASSKGDPAVRMPFGNQRSVTLAHFSQAIFLLFSAVYVCKESVEHVLLLHGGTEAEGAHGTGHGSMGHGDSGMMSGGGAHHKEMEGGIALPVVMLTAAAACSMLSAVALRNHQGLTDAVGPSSLSLARPRPRQVEPSMIDRLGNPFTLTVSVFSIGLVLSAFTIPGVQLAPLDKVLALLQSVAMALIAYPAARATGQVLLQTAPPAKTAQMTSLHSGLRDLSNHPQVVELDKVRIWQLTPQHPQGNGVSEFFIPGSPTQKRRRTSSVHGKPQESEVDRTTLVVTMTVKVRNDATDDDMREVARFARDRCRAGLKVGVRGAVEGEVTVQVERVKKGEELKFWQDRSTDSPLKGRTLGLEYDLIHEHDEQCEHDHGHGHDHNDDELGHAAHSHSAHAHNDHPYSHEDHSGHSHAAEHAGHSHSHSHAH